MTPSPKINQVIVVPRNGLANRLQAWASAAAFAEAWSVPLRVVWEPGPFMPAAASDLFGYHTVDKTFVESTLVKELTGFAHEELPRYLNHVGDALVLAGHDRGEQALIPELMDRLSGNPAPSALVIIAGGNFTTVLKEARVSDERRGRFYSRIDWSPMVRDRFEDLTASLSPYVALHIRETDRSREAPTRRMIRQALTNLRRRCDIRSLFIAADSDQSRTFWCGEAERLGYAPWVLPITPTPPSVSVPATGVRGMQDAAADWVALSLAEGMIFSGASTFSREASLVHARQELVFPLAPSPFRVTLRSTTAWFKSLATYPQRHWFNQHAG